MIRLSILSICFVVAFAAQAMNIAYVNMETLFEKYHKTEDADAKLKTHRESIKDVLKEYDKDLKELRDSYIKLREDSTNIALAEDERSKKREQMSETGRAIEAKRKDAVRFQKQKMKEVQDKYEASRDELIKELSKYIKDWAPKKGYDLVLDISGKTLNGISGIVYYSKDKDITEELLKAVNAGFEKKAN